MYLNIYQYTLYLSTIAIFFICSVFLLKGNLKNRINFNCKILVLVSVSVPSLIVFVFYSRYLLRNIQKFLIGTVYFSVRFQPLVGKVRVLKYVYKCNTYAYALFSYVCMYIRVCGTNGRETYWHSKYCLFIYYLVRACNARICA